MPLTLNIGDNALAVDTLTDLSALVTQNGGSGTVFNLITGGIKDLTQPISQFKPLDTDISLSYQSNPQKWNLDGGIFTFGISGGVSGTLHVYSPGKDLFSYTKTLPPLNGFDSTTTDDNSGTFSIPGGNYYVGLSLQLTLDVTSGGAGNVGFVGIKGSSEASGTYTFSFFKQVGPNTSISDALIAAFESFTLPLHDRTFANLSAGDSILHSFKADLKLGMGLSYGIQSPSVAQNLKAALPTVAQGFPSASASVNPSAGLSVSLTANFEYTGAFDAYLWKESEVLGHYHLYRSTTLDKSFGIDVNASLISNASVTLSGGDVASMISSAVKGQTGQVIGQIVSQNTNVQSSLDTGASDIINSITNILKPIQSVKADLQVSIEATDTKSLLLNLTIDLSKPGFDLAAWDSISAGDFVSAIEQQHSGITVDPASGLEQLHHRKTDLKFTFFNFTEEWSTTHINDYSITYVGNNSYAFTNNVGLAEITNIDKRGKEIQFYFTTSLNADAAGNYTVQDPDLHVNVKSTNNQRFGVQIPKFLALISTGVGANLAYQQMKSVASNQNATIELDVVFKSSAYQRLLSSPCPLEAVGDEAQDRTNYSTFARAVWNANDDVSNIPDFSYRNTLDIDYDSWALARKTQDDQFPPNPANLPNRKNGWLGLQNSQVQAAVHSIFGSDMDQMTGIQIISTENVGQSFMNLCQDVKGISVFPTAGAGNPLQAAQQAWNSLNGQIGYILKNDVDSSYLVPIVCALAQLMMGQGGQITYSAPVLPTSQDPGYKLSVEFS